MERALVTGAAGFIGSHLASGLLRQGWHVTGLDMRSYARSADDGQPPDPPSGGHAELPGGGQDDYLV
jgi:nucleoside-diphosphate-sugar epimerase